MSKINRNIPEDSKKRMLDALKRGRENSLKNKQSIPLDKLKFLSSVRNRLFKSRGRICEICGWSKINSFHNIIPVEIHHIDGNKKNNVENNLQILCPNCHSLTNNYGFFGRKHKTSTRPKK